MAPRGVTGRAVLRRAAVIAFGAFVAIACAGVNAANALRYGTSSLGDPAHAALTDVAGLSEHHMLSRLEMLQRTPRSGTMISDAAVPTIGKLEQSYSFPTPILFLGDVGAKYDYADPARGPLGNVTFGSKAYRDELRSLIREHTQLYQDRRFPSPPAAPYDRFELDTRIPPALRRPGTLFMRSPNTTLFNTPDGPPSYDVQLVPWNSVHDHLVLVPSGRASSGIFDRPPRREPSIMVSRSEPDPLMRGGQIEAIGRYLLFAIVNPSPKIRLRLDYTATLNPDRSARIPPVVVIGTRRERFTVAGRGAARLVSPPLTPSIVDGVPLIEVDMGTNGSRFKDKRTGLLAIFGKQYRLDPRRLVGYVRDVSLISEDEYRRTTPPAAIASFPRGLRDRDLEFSGIYEDGWASERATATLSAPRGGSGAFVVRGSLPGLPGVTDSVVHVRIDGAEAAAQPIAPGEFEVRANARRDGARHRVELTFDRAFTLPSGDGRVASALLSYLGYE
jgi:hypothetical protein